MLKSPTNAAILSALLFAAAPRCADAQSHEKKEDRIVASEKPQNVKGGTTFQVAVSYYKAYTTALNYLKREGYTIDSASAETGQVVTAMDIKGGYRQTGTRVLVTCIKDSDEQTSVRVSVTEQHRTKLLQTEPWNGAKTNESESSRIATQIKTAIGG